MPHGLHVTTSALLSLILVVPGSAVSSFQSLRGGAQQPISSRIIATRFGATARGCPTCGAAEQVGTVPPEITEVSGMTASDTHKDKHAFYVVDDSPMHLQIHAINESGGLLSTLTLNGVDLSADRKFGQHNTGDLEAIQVGPCTVGGTTRSCIFVGDIGQNCIRPKGDCNFLRPEGLYSIIRCPEPESLSAQVNLDCQRFFFKLPDGSYDAETLLINPEGELFLVTKVDSGPAGLYKLPALENTGVAPSATRLADVSGDTETGHGWITDGEFSNSEFLLVGLKDVIVFQEAATPDSAVTSAHCEEALPLDLLNQTEAVLYEPGSGSSSFSYLLMSDGDQKIMKVNCTSV